MWKKILTDKRVYISAIIMFVIGLIPFFVAMLLALIPSSNVSFSSYPYVIWGILVFYFFVGYVWGDIFVARTRHKISNYDGKLSDEIRTSAWKRRTPFFLSAGTLLILALILELSRHILGFYIFG